MARAAGSAIRAAARTVDVAQCASQISAVVVTKALDRLRALDIDPDPILADIGLDPSKLTGEDARVSLLAFTSLLELAAQRASAPRLGLQLAASLGPEALGRLGRLMVSAPTPLDALRVLERYISTVQDSTIQHVEFNDDGAAFIYQIDDNRIIHRAQDAEFSIALVFQILLRHCGDQRPFEVMFEHGPIERWRYYDHYFGCPVYFNQRANALVFKASALNAPLARADDGSAARVRDELDRMLQEQSASTAAEISAYIHRQSFESDLTVDQVAKAFGVSVSTLSRRLAQEGVSYRALVDRKRRELAERLLTASDLSIAEIALQLGYSENATFSRSFHRWTGISPRQFRKRAREAGATARRDASLGGEARAETEKRAG